MDSNRFRTWAEVDTGALRKNYNVFRRLAGKKALLMAVAKSNAYGHNLAEFALLMQKLGADWIGIDSISEALALRRHKIKKPLLILGYTMPSLLREAANKKISVTISNFELLHSAVRARMAGCPLKIHIKIDTGMHRQGFFPEDVPEIIRIIGSRGSKIKLEGVYTHFAAAKNPAFPRDTLNQINKFKLAVSQFKNAGYAPIVHAAATSGAIVFPQSRCDMVRIGIGMYGLWPSREVRAAFGDGMKLTPALSWRTIIAETKWLRKGDRTGYDFTETVARRSKIAVCPVGYWHGYRRAFSGIGRVLVRGRRAKILGRVSMDMIVIDITKIKGAKAGDVATLLGRDKKEEITADELADLACTVNYEIVTQINPRIHRIYK